LHLRRDGLLRGYERLQFRLFGDDDPSQNISNDPGNDSRHERNEEPQDADKRYIKPEVPGQSGTHSGDLSVASQANQFFGNWRIADYVAAVGTETAIVNYGFSASITKHRCALSYLGYDLSYGGRMEFVPGFLRRGKCEAASEVLNEQATGEIRLLQRKTCSTKRQTVLVA
jgi:hypothetical protein